VGGTGFVINFIILVCLHKFLDINIFIAQLLAAEIALFSNFMLHHNWTYKDKNVKKSPKTLLIQFHATTWPAILGSAIMVSITVKYLHFSNFLALVASSVISLLWNFGWSKYVLWRNVSEEEIEKIAT
jgi:putative flippase GtrA